MAFAPHILGIDDGPFSKEVDANVDLVGVMMEGSTLIEGIAVNTFPVDGMQVTSFLTEWIKNMKWYASLQAVMLGGITIAGLGIIDIKKLSCDLSIPVVAVTRSSTGNNDLKNALMSAGYEERIEVLQKTPSSQQVREGIHISFAGTGKDYAERLIDASLQKARLPEPLRVAHLMATAVAIGESKGNA